MKTIFKLGFLLIIVLIISYCTEESDNLQYTTSRIVQSQNIDIDYSVSVIPLENNDTILLGSISNVAIGDNKLFILDRRTLYIFSEEGKFLKKLSNGKGPGELQLPLTFKYDDFRKELIIVDKGAWIKIYSSSGEFKSSYYSGMLCLDAFKVTDNILALSSGYSGNSQDHLLYFFNLSEKKIVDQFLPNENLPLKNLNIIAYNNFTNSKANTYFMSPNCRTIYKITDQIPKPFIKLDFEKLEPPKEFIRKFKKGGMFLREAHKKNYIGFVNYFYHIKNFYIVGIKHKNYDCVFINDDKRENMQFASLSKIYNLPDYHSLKVPVNVYDDKLLFSFEPNEAFDKTDTSEFKTINLGGKAIRIKEDDNPILVIVKNN